MTLNALIIDDEKAGRAYLKTLIEEFIPSLQLVGTAGSAFEGMKVLAEQKVDIIFVDVEMPNINGFDFLEVIDQSKYKIVFTTAHKEYALKAFNVFADGYLLKPIDLDDLEALVERLVLEVPIEEEQKLVFRTQNSIEYINPDHIIRIESDGSYSTIYSTNNRKVTVTKNIKQIGELLQGTNFLKTHKSHILNKKFILRYVKLDGGYFEMTDQSVVPLSRRKKDEILGVLSSEN